MIEYSSFAILPNKRRRHRMKLHNTRREQMMMIEKFTDLTKLNYKNVQMQMQMRY